METTNRYVITKIIQNEKGLHNGGYLELDEEQLLILIGKAQAPKDNVEKRRKFFDRWNELLKTMEELMKGTHNEK